jgi:hypothetical protein
MQIFIVAELRTTPYYPLGKARNKFWLVERFRDRILVQMDHQPKMAVIAGQTKSEHSWGNSGSGTPAHHQD